MKFSELIGMVVKFALALLFIAPVLFMLSASFKPEASLLSDSNSWQAFVPSGELTLKNYQAVLTQTPFMTYLFNSIIIALSSVLLVCSINSMAAYALLRLPVYNHHVILLFVLALLVIPFEVIVLPLVLVITNLPWINIENGELEWVESWFNTLHVQIIPELANPFFIFLFYQAFKNNVKDYEEAALLQGASIWRVFWQIVVPMNKAVFAAVAILTFLRSWNAYLLPAMVAQKEQVRPVTVGMAQFFNNHTDWSVVMAYACLITLPVALFFLLAQKYFVSAFNHGLKG